jgi:hypothetical protein
MSARPFLARALPTGAPTIAEAPSAILPALAMFRNCRAGLEVRLLLDVLPDHVAAALAAHVAERPVMFDLESSRELVRAVGYGRLSQIMGPQKARGAIARLFPQS